MRARQREASPISEGDLADSPCLLLDSFAWKRVFALSESDARKRVLVAGAEKDEDGALGELLSICVDGIALVRLFHVPCLPSSRCRCSPTGAHHRPHPLSHLAPIPIARFLMFASLRREGGLSAGWHCLLIRLTREGPIVGRKPLTVECCAILSGGKGVTHRLFTVWSSTWQIFISIRHYIQRYAMQVRRAMLQHRSIL